MATFPARWAPNPEMSLEWLIFERYLMREGSEQDLLFEIGRKSFHMAFPFLLCLFPATLENRGIDALLLDHQVLACRLKKCLPNRTPCPCPSCRCLSQALDIHFPDEFGSSLTASCPCCLLFSHLLTTLPSCMPSAKTNCTVLHPCSTTLGVV